MKSLKSILEEIVITEELDDPKQVRDQILKLLKIPTSKAKGNGLEIKGSSGDPVKVDFENLSLKGAKAFYHQT